MQINRQVYNHLSRDCFKERNRTKIHPSLIFCTCFLLPHINQHFSVTMEHLWSAQEICVSCGEGEPGKGVNLAKGQICMGLFISNFTIDFKLWFFREYFPKPFPSFLYYLDFMCFYESHSTRVTDQRPRLARRSAAPSHTAAAPWLQHTILKELWPCDSVLPSSPCVTRHHRVTWRRLLENSVLQCVAVCCNVLQQDRGGSLLIGCRVVQCVAVWCRVLLYVAVCCNLLRCVAVCCKVLQLIRMVAALWKAGPVLLWFLGNSTRNYTPLMARLVGHIPCVIHMYTYMYMYIYIYIYISVYACVCVYICLYIHVYTSPVFVCIICVYA